MNLSRVFLAVKSLLACNTMGSTTTRYLLEVHHNAKVFREIWALCASLEDWCEPRRMLSEQWTVQAGWLGVMNFCRNPPDLELKDQVWNVQEHLLRSISLNDVM